jgi:hypothetical protein
MEPQPFESSLPGKTAPGGSPNPHRFFRIESRTTGINNFAAFDSSDHLETRKNIMARFDRAEPFIASANFEQSIIDRHSLAESSSNPHPFCSAAHLRLTQKGLYPTSESSLFQRPAL